MEFVKLNYDDFYKFVMSAGVLLFTISVSVVFYLLIKKPVEVLELPNQFTIWITLGITLIGSASFIYWSGNRWNINQKIIDERLKEELRIIKQTTQESISIKSDNKTDRNISKKVALVEYKIASVLPGTVIYDLIDSGKVWFWIANTEDKKYRVYIEVELISENYSKKIDESYYGGKKEWNLNAFSGIHAPGMPIPHEIIELAKKGKRIEIKINCTIKDENDKLVEKKLPISYVYDKKNKSWYFEP